MHRIGIDLGGTKFHAILSEGEVTNVIHQERHPTAQEKGYESLLERISAVVGKIKADFGLKECGVGMGIPGTLGAGGKVRFSNAEMLKGKHLARDLSQCVGSEVKIENDANCFALSEAKFGAAKNETSVLGVILGTGMGGGVVVDGKLRPGRNGNTGEWGHARFLRSGPAAWTGMVGEYERYLSGTGASLWYESLHGTKRMFTEILEGYRNGGEEEKAFMDRYFDYFGRAMGNLINFFDPAAIVFGGGLSHVDEIYSEGRERTRPRVFGDEFKTKFLKPKLGDYSGVFGAAALN